jgi:predicted dehydrogenase
VGSVSKNIGLGVVGTGLGALLLRINQVEDSRLQVRGLYDPDPGREHQRYDAGKRLHALADEFAVPFVADTYEQLLDRPDIHAVAVFSPCPCHFAQITAALKAGKHVLVTKPMVTSLDEARQIVNLVDRTGLKLLVAQSMRWNGMFQAIHDLHDAGETGDVRLAEAYYMHDLRPVLDVSPWRYEMPQDLMYGGVCHPVDLLRWFLGEVDEVFAYGTRGSVETRYPAGKADNFMISLKYRSGAIARVMGGFDLVHPPSLWGQTFHGVGIGLYGTRASVFNDRLVRDYYPGGQPQEEPITPRGGHLTHSGEVFGFLRHFEDCLAKGEEPLVGVRDGAQIVAICSACWDSIHTGLPAKVTREFDRAAAATP